MKKTVLSWRCLGLAAGLCLAAGAGPAARPQAPAARPAAARVPIAFSDFHGYTATVEYLRKVAAAHPAITSLVEIGRSSMDRPIYVLVVTNLKTGAALDALLPLRNQRLEGGAPVKNVTPMKPYQGKPGIWIDGGTHGNEFTGTEVCLYTIDKLVSGYGADAELTRLIDANTFYICPVVNPDGVFNSADKGISQRGNSMLRDDDGDGKVNEDGPDDLDGDGAIVQFRYRDDKGAFVVSDADPRLMVRVGPNETTTKPRYTVVPEDRDNDGDGKRGEDGESGIDVNRNFPEGWYRDDQEQGGTGAYPSSSPEARAILEFFTDHTNILLVQSFHTSGGFTYRPMARWPDSRMDARDVSTYDRVMGKRYLELIGEPVPASWLERRTAAPAGAEERGDLAGETQGQGRGGIQRAAQPGQAQTPSGQAGAPPRGFRHPYSDDRRAPYGYGVFLDWAYAQFGSWSMSTELWNWQRDTKGLAGYAGEADRAKWELAYLAHQEKALGSRAFKPWKPFKHPELGAGELGGWISRYGASNAIPGDSLLGVCETHWQFELFKATLLPRLVVREASARVLYTTDDPGALSVTHVEDQATVKGTSRKGRYQDCRGESDTGQRRPARDPPREGRVAAREPRGCGLADRGPVPGALPPGRAVDVAGRARRDAGRIRAARSGTAGTPVVGAWRTRWGGHAAPPGPAARAAGGARAVRPRKPARGELARRARGRHAAEGRARVPERWDGRPRRGDQVRARRDIMHTLSIRSTLAVIALALALGAGWSAAVVAQKPLQASPGGSHGENDFPISWKQYYSYAEKVKMLQACRSGTRQLAELSTIGKSRMGRDQRMLTITANATGAAETKPAMWVDGAIHGNEINGVTCSLYTAWYLLTRYDYDPYVQRLVNAARPSTSCRA